MSAITTTGRGLGLAVAIPKDVILVAAGAVERGGYTSFWLNNPPGADALSVLGDVARLAPSLQLGVGVIPLSALGPEQIATEVQRAGVSVNRLYLGIGSGAGPDGLQRAAAGLKQLRSRYEGRIVVAALGPRMCRLAGSHADGVLFNWLTPEFAARSLDWVREGADDAGRSMPPSYAYVRVGLGPEAAARLQK